MGQDRAKVELDSLRWRLTASEERQQILAELGRDLVFDTDLATGQTTVFGDAQKILGRPVNLERFPQGEIGDGRCHPEDYPKLKQMIERVASGERGRDSCELRIQRGDGGFGWYQIQMARMRAENGEACRQLVRMEDISEQKRREALLLAKTRRDEMTGLYSASAFQELSDDILSQGEGERHALILLDIDGFETINTTYGCEVGNEVLRTLAKRITATFRAVDLVGRVGDDEFAVMARELSNSVTALQKGREACMAVNESLDLGNGVWTAISCSVGIALFPQHGEDCETLLSRAQIALDYVKRNGKNGVTLYQEEMLALSVFEQRYSREEPPQTTLERTPEELELIGHLCSDQATTLLEGAMEREELELYLQPQVELESKKIRGAEVLVRWVHPQYGLIPPSIFVPVLERKGLTARLDEYMLRQTCALLRKWMDAGEEPVPLAVNQTRFFVSSEGYAQAVEQVLEEYRIPPQMLVIEVTESSIWDYNQSISAALNQLRAKGVQTAIDDFGSGFTSLSLLSTLAVDEVKLDSSFANGESSARNDLVIKSVAGLCHSIGSTTVVEGVETREQETRMKMLGCDVAQGYYFARPMPAGKFLDYLRAHRRSEGRKENRGKWKRNPIHREVLRVVLCSLAAFLLLGIGIWVAHVKSGENERAQIESMLGERTRIEAAYVKNYLQKNIQKMEAVAAHLADLPALDSDQAVERLELVRAYTNCKSLSIVFPNGDGLGDCLDLAQLDAKQLVAETAKAEWRLSDVMADSEGENYYLMSVPIRRDGVLEGVLVEAISTEDLTQLLREIATEENGCLEIFQRGSGRYVLQSGEESGRQPWENFYDIQKAEFAPGYGFESLEEELMAGRSGIVAYQDENGTGWYGYYVPIEVGDWVLLSLTVAESADRHAQQMELILNRMMGVTLLAFIALIFLTGVALLRRQQRLERFSKEMAYKNELLAISEERYAVALRNTSDVILEYDIQSRGLTQSARAHAIWDVEASCEEVPESLIESGLICQEDQEVVRKLYQSLCEGRPTATAIFRVRTRQGEYAWCKTTYTTIFNWDGKPVRAVGLAENIDKQKRFADQLAQEQYYRKSLIQNYDLQCEINVTKNQYVTARDRLNDHPEIQLESDPATDYRNNLVRRTHPDDQGRMPEELTAETCRQMLREGRSVVGAELRMRPGEERPYRWWSVQIVVYQDDLSQDVFALLLYRDIQAEKAHSIQLRDRAERDSMTGLLNRAECQRQVSQQLSLERERVMGALLLLDVDDLKGINDILGHPTGDKAILAVARELKRVFRTTDVIGRIGGDEFFVYMQNVKSGEVVRRRAEQLLEQVRKVSLGEGALERHLTLSIGIALEKGESQLEELYQRADQALYQAKRGGRDRYCTDQSPLWEE